MFGVGRPRALDRNAKARIMHWARCLSRRTAKGKAYGQITAKALAVLEALLWGFHNAKSGFCFPSYERIAEAAHCAVSTVGEAIKALEAAGLMTWVNRLKRVRERCADLLGADGWRWRVMRTSNAYEFRDPGAADRPDPSKSENQARTANQDLFLFNEAASRGVIRRHQGGGNANLRALSAGQEASGKTKPRKRTKTRANRPLFCATMQTLLNARKRSHVQIHHFSGPGRRRS